MNTNIDQLTWLPLLLLAACFICFFIGLFDGFKRKKLKKEIKILRDSADAQIKGVWMGYNGLAKRCNDLNERCDELAIKLLGEPLYKPKEQYADIIVDSVGLTKNGNNNEFYYWYRIFDLTNKTSDTVKEEVITRRIQLFSEGKIKKSAVKKAVAKVAKRK